MPPPGELYETYVSSLILAMGFTTWKSDVILKTGNTQRIVRIVRGGPIYGLRNQIPKNLVKFGHVFWYMPLELDRQTDTQAYRRADYNT